MILQNYFFKNFDFKKKLSSYFPGGRCGLLCNLGRIGRRWLDRGTKVTWDDLIEIAISHLCRFGRGRNGWSPLFVILAILVFQKFRILVGRSAVSVIILWSVGGVPVITSSLKSYPLLRFQSNRPRSFWRPYQFALVQIVSGSITLTSSAWQIYCLDNVTCSLTNIYYTIAVNFYHIKCTHNFIL